MVLVLFLLEFIINWSYYKKVPAFDISEKSDVYFKSHWHKKFNYKMNILFAMMAILVIIQWVFFEIKNKTNYYFIDGLKYEK